MTKVSLLNLSARLTYRRSNHASLGPIYLNTGVALPIYITPCSRPQATRYHGTMVPRYTIVVVRKPAEHNRVTIGEVPWSLTLRRGVISGVHRK